MKVEKAERRDQKRRSRGKMGVNGASVKRLLQIIQEKANKVEVTDGG